MRILARQTRLADSIRSWLCDQISLSLSFLSLLQQGRLATTAAVSLKASRTVMSLLSRRIFLLSSTRCMSHCFFCFCFFLSFLFFPLLRAKKARETSTRKARKLCARFSFSLYFSTGIKTTQCVLHTHTHTHTSNDTKQLRTTSERRRRKKSLSARQTERCLCKKQEKVCKFCLSFSLFQR